MDCKSKKKWHQKKNMVLWHNPCFYFSLFVIIKAFKSYQSLKHKSAQSEISKLNVIYVSVVCPRVYHKSSCNWNSWHPRVLFKSNKFQFYSLLLPKMSISSHLLSFSVEAENMIINIKKLHLKIENYPNFH